MKDKCTLSAPTSNPKLCLPCSIIMRLIDCRSLRLIEADADVTPYAILSHTWEPNQEVDYAEFIAGAARRKRGWTKIRRACQLALGDGFSYLWIDTCGIDKTSSAELSEAINSMYKWYAGAKACYAHLADVEDSSELAQSRWFTRGWTLQELLAPRELVFYTKDWVRIGRKYDDDLCPQVAAITGIDEAYLADRPIELASVAQRMSWAAKRETTRVEDLAYSLMGIFSVNMPLIYGEGAKAFLRLQEEIIKVSSDESIFAWKDPNATRANKSGLLALSPAFFLESSVYVPYPQPRNAVPFSMTNQGISITIQMSFINNDGLEDSYIALLNCPHPKGKRDSLAIKLIKSATSGNYSRIDCNKLYSCYPLGLVDKAIRVEQGQPPYYSEPDPQQEYVFDIRTLPPLELGYRIINFLVLDQRFAPRLGPDNAPRESLTPAFYLSKKSGDPSCSLLIDSHESERILVTIGSFKSSIIGFSALGVPKSISTVGQAWHHHAARMWEPGTELSLKRHKVCVSVEASPMNTSTHFYVDISIKAVQRIIPTISLGRLRVTEDEPTEVTNQSSSASAGYQDESQNHLQDANAVFNGIKDDYDSIMTAKRANETNNYSDNGPPRVKRAKLLIEDAKRLLNDSSKDNSASIDVNEAHGVSSLDTSYNSTRHESRTPRHGMLNDPKNEVEVNGIIRTVGNCKRGWSGSTGVIDIGTALAWEMKDQDIYEHHFREEYNEDGY